MLIIRWVVTVVLFGGSLSIIDESRYVGLVLFKEGLDLFSLESSLRPPVILLSVADLSFRPPLVMPNGGI